MTDRPVLLDGARRLTFREWSICVSLGEIGIEMVHARRAARRAVLAVRTAIWNDVLRHGSGVSRVSMGEGCTPIIQRIDPFEVALWP